jgi:hypothetical protein
MSTTQQQQNPTKGGLIIRTKSFFKKAMNIAFYDDGKISLAKCAVTGMCIAYVVLINPFMIAAIVELMMIFGIIWFFIKLFFGKDEQSKTEGQVAKGATP